MPIKRNRGRDGHGGGRRSEGTTNEVPLPPDVRRLIDRNEHPGLALDKLAATVTSDFGVPSKLQEIVQKPTAARVAELTSRFPTELYRRLFSRQERLWKALRSTIFRACTSGPMTLHLSRASSLENAGIALHRVYGFPVLPGTGLKGMARAYAETVWFATQFRRDDQGRPTDEQEAEKAASAWRTIEAVFGWSPNSDAGKHYRPACVEKPDHSASAGAIVFHDAWGTAVPKLESDIVNNHHRNYYTDKQAPPPGDWESPNPVYFLTISPGQEFTFALSCRSQGSNQDGLLHLAVQWLIGALQYEGAGAKTRSGYGFFDAKTLSIDSTASSAVGTTWSSALELGLRRASRVEVELSTPAFLAGAEQFDEPLAMSGCDLRPATLRGLLRWWWRTMHAGFVDPAVLREMEALVFGDTQQAGAAQVIVHATGRQVHPERFAFRDDRRPNREFMNEYRLTEPPNRKTTQGLFYASYGMDESSRGQQRRRFYRPAGARWSLELIGRPNQRTIAGHPCEVSAEAIWQQLSAACWLLLHYGGIGSKSRKGFGSLRHCQGELGVQSLQDCRDAAGEWRRQLGLPNRFQPEQAESPALGDPRDDWLHQFEITIPAHNEWQAMDAVGLAYELAAQSYKHDERKMALGLPRRIHGPRREPLRDQHQENWQRPFPLRGPQGDRHASPVVIHVEAAENGFVVRTIAFPAAYLPDLTRSKSFLSEFLSRFQDNLRDWRPPSGSRRAPRSSGGRPPGATARPRQTAARSLPNPGDIVEAILQEEKTRKGGWKAKHDPSGLVGPIQNTKDCPSDWKPGEVVKLTVQYANPNAIAFRYVERT